MKHCICGSQVWLWFLSGCLPVVFLLMITVWQRYFVFYGMRPTANSCQALWRLAHDWFNFTREALYGMSSTTNSHHVLWRHVHDWLNFTAEAFYWMKPTTNFNYYWEHKTKLKLSAFLFLFLYENKLTKCVKRPLCSSVYLICESVFVLINMNIFGYFEWVFKPVRNHLVLFLYKWIKIIYFNNE